VIVKIKSRDAATWETIETSAECNTLEDLRKITTSIVSSSEAWLNDLQVVKHGLIEMFMYNYTKEVLLYLQGNPKELNAKLNREV